MSEASTGEQEDVLARIRRSNAETEKFIEEAFKLRAEEAKLQAEARKLGRDASIAPFTVILGALTAGAALFGAGAAFVRLLGP